MSQKSSVPQAVSFVSQVLKRDTCRDAGVGAIAPGFAMLGEQNALHTLIHQRHLTPSCGGHAPTAERTLNPARMFMESLTPGPELENRLGHSLPNCDVRVTSVHRIITNVETG